MDEFGKEGENEQFPFYLFRHTVWPFFHSVNHCFDTVWEVLTCFFHYTFRILLSYVIFRLTKLKNQNSFPIFLDEQLYCRLRSFYMFHLWFFSYIIIRYCPVSLIFWNPYQDINETNEWFCNQKKPWQVMTFKHLRLLWPIILLIEYLRNYNWHL